MKPPVKPTIVLLLLLIFSVGVYLRSRGLFSHVTYIDEILLLTQADLVPINPASLSPQPLVPYVYKTVMSKGNSYGPIPLLLARIIAGPDMFSVRALKILRLLSLTFSVLSLILFGYLCITVIPGVPWSGAILVFTIFSCQMIQWVNAKQGHSYSAGVFAVLCGLVLITFLAQRLTPLRIFLMVLCFTTLSLFHYQVLLLNTAMGIGLIVESRLHKTKDLLNQRRLYCFAGGAILLVTLCLILGVAILKKELMNPWWIGEFINPDKWAVFSSLANSGKNLFSVLLVLSLFATGGESYPFGVVSAILLLMGILGIVIADFKKRKDLLVQRVLLLFLALWFLSFWLGKTPMSPTRHCMVYLPAILLIQLSGFRLIGHYFSNWKFSGCLLFFSGAILVFTLGRFPEYLKASTETANFGQLNLAAHNYRVTHIATWLWDYSKLQLLQRNNSSRYNLVFAWPGHLDMLPNEPTIFMELNTHSELSVLYSKTTKFNIKELSSRVEDFDFEPAKTISYGQNQFKLWFLQPKT